MLDVLLILLLSFVPMVIYAVIFWWFDRYEKEPLALLAMAFVWGAIPSIILAIIMQVILDVPVVAISANQLMYDLLGASVVAPLTEEGVKGAALILLLLVLRREIDSPMDGLLYGGVVGFGFAAVENVLYLFGAYSESGVGGVFALAFLRAGVFGLNHAMYTAFTGLGVALALEVRSWGLKLVTITGGFGLAMFTHALHNALATFVSQVGGVSLLGAVVADWGGVLVILMLAVGAFFLERKRIMAYAQALVDVNVIPQQEVDILKSTMRRRMARMGVLLEGDVRRWRLMRRYHQRVTEAAFAWHRMNEGDPRAQRNLKRLEEEFQRLRRELSPNSLVAVE